ncbi:unnamed protein product [Ambrosiozyma monospora]|uniref:Unnamed protein product n=1 Tax=Ambrosiozyma monospora TaxID=43982 RepID=A0ACB5T145_AMBMO|nr:unnamed protein product [Ambrosiozyma monospora]
MKFGAEFNDRSISKWKNYNIDYNDLKLKIKLATSNKAPNPSTSSEESLVAYDKTQKKLLKKLYKSFKQQIGFVSLFVNSKYGELSRRIQTSRNSLNDIISKTDTPETLQSKTYQRLRNRKLAFIYKELNNISTDLQELSRFILLQKIAVKKLLKKFIKYSDYH